MKTRRFISPKAGTTGLSILLALSFFVFSTFAQAFGTFEQPFTEKSYWNIRPVGPKLGSFQIPDSVYFPSVSEGPYSSAAFLAKQSDSTVNVIGQAGKAGVWELDGEQFVNSISIKRWPASTLPASGSDGHADIVDPIDGVVHSFFNLKKDGQGRWTASMYAWTRLSGRGWAEPGHYYQGARATAVPPLAGLIRKHEVNDGKPLYQHALALSLTHNALSSTTGYVFPASSADATWRQNTGQIPQGALLMLPQSFDTGTIEDPALRKVAETLKVYGAYVVDRNTGTPFYIYVENGSNFNLHKPKWNSRAANSLKHIQRELRQVVGVQGWLNGHGHVFTPSERFNMASMRGSWEKRSGPGAAKYDTWSQSIIVTGANQHTEFQNSSNRAVDSTNWGKMQAGKRYSLQVKTSHGAQLEWKIMNAANNQTLFHTGWLSDGDSYTFKWPSGAGRSVLTVGKFKDKTMGQSVSVRAMVFPVDDWWTSPLENATLQAR